MEIRPCPIIASKTIPLAMYKHAHDWSTVWETGVIGCTVEEWVKRSAGAGGGFPSKNRESLLTSVIKDYAKFYAVYGPADFTNANPHPHDDTVEFSRHWVNFKHDVVHIGNKFLLLGLTRSDKSSIRHRLFS